MRDFSFLSKLTQDRSI